MRYAGARGTCDIIRYNTRRLTSKSTNRLEVLALYCRYCINTGACGSMSYKIKNKNKRRVRMRARGLINIMGPGHCCGAIVSAPRERLASSVSMPLRCSSMIASGSVGPLGTFQRCAIASLRVKNYAPRRPRGRLLRLSQMALANKP